LLNEPMKKSSWSARCFVIIIGFLYSLNVLRAQQSVSSELQYAPELQHMGAGSTATASSLPPANQQTKRILGIFPNFRAVSADTHLPPQSVKEKFVTTSQDSFDYSAFVLPALLAGEQQATNATPEFYQEEAGYARYFWHTYLDQTSENYWVEFIGPVLAREDTRYYTLGAGKGRALTRMGYALSRAVVTRNDAGKDTFNISEVVGAGAAAGLSNLYYPASDRSFSNTADRWAVNMGVDAVTFIVREFWPDINHALFHGPGSQPATIP